MTSSPLLVAVQGFLRRNAVALRLLLIGFLTLLLLIPLALVQSTLRERLVRHETAVATIIQSWGKSQRLIGPILVVPFTWKADVEESATGVDGRRYRETVTKTHTSEAFFLPELLEITGQLEPSERRLGIYSAHVYAAKLRWQGRFGAPTFEFTGVSNAEPQWDRARICFAVTDLRGTRQAVTLSWSGKEVLMQAGSKLEGFGPGLHAPVAVTDVAGAPNFSLELNLNGSTGIAFVPIARQTMVQVTSPWKSPGFFGAFLPMEREIGANGFSATWQVGFYGRDFPQQWTTALGAAPGPASIEASAFGVNLVDTITAYRTIERAIKYGVLFLALVFSTFFLFEVVSAVRLNALNYLLVGFALCLFYLGLLSLSEFIGFTSAYAGAAALSLLMVGLYGWSVLQEGRRALVVSGLLAGVYAYLYMVVRMEDFALLAGTGALFALLAAVMFATRRLEPGVAFAVVSLQEGTR
jgi:inner membrane protein